MKRHGFEPKLVKLLVTMEFLNNHAADKEEAWDIVWEYANQLVKKEYEKSKEQREKK